MKIIIVTAIKTVKSVEKEQKAAISMNGIFLSNLRSAYDAFEFSCQKNAINGASSKE